MISVCMPTYNGRKYIKEQLLSILSQLKDNDEVIISDDGSTDNTVDVIKSINDKRIKLLFHEHPECRFRGIFKTMYVVAKNVENALQHASGDYLFLSDQDDIWLPQKVEKSLAALQNNDLIIHDMYVVTEDLTITHNSFFDIRKPHTDLLRNLICPSFAGCCMAFTSRLKNIALPFPDDAVEHDTWIGLCAIKYGKTKILHEPLVKYRRHENNVSFFSGQSKNSLFIKFLRRFIMLKYYLSAAGSK